MFESKKSCTTCNESDTLHSSGAQLGGEEGPSLPFFENQKKCPDFGKKIPNCVHPWVESSIQNVVLGVSRRKSLAFLCFIWKVYRSTTLIPQYLPNPEKVLVARLKLDEFYRIYLVLTEEMAEKLYLWQELLKSTSKIWVDARNNMKSSVI